MQEPGHDGGAVPVSMLDQDDLFDQTFFEKMGSPIDFASPWMLATLPPALLIGFMLMRSIERRPKEVSFPAMFILEMLDDTERDPDRMPWWQQMINYGAISAAVMGAAGPTWNAPDTFSAEGPVILAVDNGWDSSDNWDDVMQKARDVVKQAYNEKREIILVQMAAPENAQGYSISSPMDALIALQSLENVEPMPWMVDYTALSEGVNAMENGQYGGAFWLGSGLAHDGVQEFVAELQSKAPLYYFENDSESLPVVLDGAEFDKGDYRLSIQRPYDSDALDIRVAGYAQDGTMLAAYDYHFSEGQRKIDVQFDVPELSSSQSISSEIFRFSVEGEKNAAAHIIVDDQWKPRSVGLVVQNRAESESLLSESRFIKTALASHAETILGGVEELVESGDVSVLVVPDAVTISGVAATKIKDWVEQGGTLVRFAGPNMARDAHTNDPLLPLDLRQGVRGFSRDVSGMAAAGVKGRIGGFDDQSPLRGIARDSDIQIEKQVMVQPGPDVEDKVWATLDDGTPLISADKRGEGQVVLFHTTANTAWGDLSLSDNFVDMLVGIVASAKSIQNEDDLDISDMSPMLTMDGFGVLGTPPGYAQNLQSLPCEVSSVNPPGLYGGSLSALACNLSTSLDDLQITGDLDDNVQREFYAVANDGYDLKGAAWSAFLILMLASTAVLMSQQGEFSRKSGRRNAKNNKAGGDDKPVHEAFLDNPEPDI